MPKAMIITVGTGETVSHGICCAIKNQNPDYIVFCLTKESREKTLPLILQDESMKDKDYEEFILEDENDVEEIRFECQKIIEGLFKKKFAPEDITVDYTSGTKAMSAGVVLSALDKRLKTLVYVSGKRDKNGRVISGTERVISLEPNRIYAELIFKSAINLFNAYQFEGCLDTLKQIENLISDVDFIEKVNLLKDLAYAYSLWDKFELNKAFSLLAEIKTDLLVKWGIKSRVENNKKILKQEINEIFCKERIADLLMNAKRRGEAERKYDDAVARIYRSLEYLAQIKIFEKDLYKKDKEGKADTENLDIDNLPETLRSKYAQYKDEKDNKVKLGLYLSYRLLEDLDEMSGKIFMEKYKQGKLKKLLSARNGSILAHGFNSVSKKTYEEMFDIAMKVAKKVYPELDRIFQEIIFPQIKIL